jgi:hypothetical protein
MIIDGSSIIIADSQKMGNIQPANGRRPLTESHGFNEAFAHARKNLKDLCQAAVSSGETGITIPYTTLLVPNPNKDTYDDYLIGQEEIRRVLMEVVHQPFTVENIIVKAGDIVFYNQSSVKVLFVYGMPAAAAVQRQPPLPASPKMGATAAAAAHRPLIDDLQPLDADVEIIGN